MRYQLLLSDSAYEGVKALAVKANYLNPNNTIRARGVGEFLQSILDANPEIDDWTDTRPGISEDERLQELEMSVASEQVVLFVPWDTNEPRASRQLYFSRHHQEQSAALAFKKGLIRISHSDFTDEEGNPKPLYRAFSWHRVTKPGALISEFWEAVGLSYLTPVNPPRPPAHRGKFRQKPFEMEW